MHSTCTRVFRGIVRVHIAYTIYKTPQSTYRESLRYNPDVTGTETERNWHENESVVIHNSRVGRPHQRKGKSVTVLKNIRGTK